MASMRIYSVINANLIRQMRYHLAAPELDDFEVDRLGRGEQETLYAGGGKLAHARGAFAGRAGDGEAPHEIVGDELGVDALLDRLCDIEAAHEALDSGGFRTRHRFHGEAKIVMRAIGEPRAHEPPRVAAVLAHHRHAGGHDVDRRGAALGFARAFRDALARPRED